MDFKMEYILRITQGLLAKKKIERELIPVYLEILDQRFDLVMKDENVSDLVGK